VPYLSKHGVRRSVVSTIYLANPTLGIWVQPRLGAWSDKINRRVPLVIALSLIALAGIATLIAAIPLTRALGSKITSSLDGSDVIPPVAIAMAFFGFGAADICFDCLLIPGRALLDDMTVPTGKSDDANALFTGFQLCGRLLALLVGSSSLTTDLWGLDEDSTDSHFNACLSVAALFLMVSMLGVVTFVDDQGSTVIIIPNDLEINSDEGRSEFEEIGACHDEQQKLQTLISGQSISNYDINNSQADSITPGQNIESQSWLCRLDASVLICAVQAAGWAGICAQVFFWTSWRGEKVGCIDLVWQSVAGVATAGLLPCVNAYFGAASVWFGSELVFHILMMSIGLVSGSDTSNSQWNIPRIIAALSGINYAVHATNGLIVATDIFPDSSNRARTIAMVNNALPMGQLITALSGGVIAQYFGGFEYVSVCFGGVGTLVTSLSWAYSSSQSIF